MGSLNRMGHSRRRLVVSGMIKRRIIRQDAPLHIRIATHIDCPMCGGSKRHLSGFPCQYWGDAKTIEVEPWLPGSNTLTCKKRNIE
jgi:hypothetical protein